MTGQQSQVFVAFVAEGMRDLWLAAFPEPDNQTVYTVKGLAKSEWYYVQADSMEQLKAAFGDRATLLRSAKVTKK